ncbi:hypothetical protein LCGC14_1898500, partial [marine sediment metagenome]
NVTITSIASGEILKWNGSAFINNTYTEAGLIAADGSVPLTADWNVGAFGMTVKTLDIVHTATEADDHALEIDADAAGFGDVKAIDIAYVTGAIAAGQDEGIILINIDETLATGGDVFGLEVLATDGGADVYGMKVGALVGPIHQDSGVFINPTTGTDNTPDTDVPNMIDGSILTTTAIFEANSEYIIIGNAAAFEEIEFILTTESSNPGIKPTFWYSTAGTGQFTQFTPVDGTNGFRNTGVVAWDASDLTGHVADTGTGTFDIKIIRTQNNINTDPVLGYAKTAATVEYVWDKNGDVSIRDLDVAGDASFTSAVSVATANGINYTPGSDTDVDIATIDVTGTPIFKWDEPLNGFLFNKRVKISATTLEVGPSDDGVIFVGGVGFVSAEAAHFNQVPGAAKPIYWYNNSTSGENQEFRLYGFPTSGALDYAAFQMVGTGTDLSISSNRASSNIILTPGSGGNIQIPTATGIDYNPGSDIDTDIITVGVTGTPKLWWDEATDSFEMNKSLTLPGASLKLGSHIISENTENNDDGFEVVGTFHVHRFSGGMAGNICLHEGTEPPTGADGDAHRIWADSLGNLLHQNSAGDSTIILTGTLADNPGQIISPDSLSDLIITNSSLIYTNSGGEKRLEVDATQTRIRGVGATPIYMKFGSSSFEINDGVDRFMSNSSKSVMASSNDTWWSACYDDRYEVMDDVRARIQANATDTRLVSPDGNDVLWLANNDLTFNDGIRDRIVADAAGTRLYSTGANASYLSIADAAIYLNDGARARVQVDDTHTYLFSPSGQKWVDVDNAGVALQGDTDITGIATIIADDVA